MRLGVMGGGSCAVLLALAAVPPVPVRGGVRPASASARPVPGSAAARPALAGELAEFDLRR
ncbi:hypothetical protein, partial [Actinomadura roseirufa]|uniref:hypothetical protein n=1 Tax=Actinomadura roseirufa TaxID=2094049 RepID=UPI001A955BB9